MFPPKVRLVLILFCIVFGVSLLIKGDRLGFLPLVAAAMFGYGYWRYGTVMRAFRALRGGETSRAAELLEQIADPSRLDAGNRAYYNLIKGAFALDRGDLDGAEKFLEAAPPDQVRTSNDRGIIAWYRARVALEKGDQATAQAHLHQARQEPHKEEVDKLIADLEKKIG
jgi:hypothetical protein